MFTNENDWQDYSGCVRNIYRAAMQPDLWDETLAAIQKYLAVEAVTMAMLDVQSHQMGFSRSTLMTEEQMALYQRDFSDKDPWMDGAAALPSNQVYQSDFIFPSKELVRTQFYEELLTSLNIFYCAGGFFYRQGNRVGMINSLMPYAEGPLGKERVAKLQSLFPHLKNAYLIAADLFELETHIRATTQVFDKIHVGVAILDKSGQVIYFNTCIRNLERKGLLKIKNKQIRFKAPQLNREINKAINSSRKNIQLTQVINYPNQLPVTVTLTSLWEDLSLQSHLPVPGAFLCCIRDPAEKCSPSGILRQFGLTPAEDLVVRTLSEGKTIKQVSQLLGLSSDTTRGHLKHIFKKLGVHSQNQLLSFCHALLC